MSRDPERVAQIRDQLAGARLDRTIARIRRPRGTTDPSPPATSGPGESDGGRGRPPAPDPNPCGWPDDGHIVTH